MLAWRLALGACPGGTGGGRDHRGGQKDGVIEHQFQHPALVEGGVLLVQDLQGLYQFWIGDGFLVGGGFLIGHIESLLIEYCGTGKALAFRPDPEYTVQAE